MMELYINLCERAKEYPVLYHYTTVDRLEDILKSRSLRLSRLDKVNDLFESQRITGLWQNKVFVACFTHREVESIPFWIMYGKGHYGVRISIPNFINQEKCLKSHDGYTFRRVERSNISHVEYDKTSDWGFFDMTVADVEYTNDFSQFVDQETYEQNYGGLIKGMPWNFEEETRMRVAMRPIGFEYAKHLIIQKPTFDCIYFHLTEEIIENIKITYNPWANLAFKQNVTEIVNKYIPSFQSDRLLSSVLEGQVKLL